VDGSYVYRSGKISKVPATDTEALKSNLMGIFEKRRCKNFFEFIQDYEEDDPKTHKGTDLKKVTMKEVYDKFGLEKDTMDFLGHAMALHQNDAYMAQPALDTVKKIKLYAESLARYILLLLLLLLFFFFSKKTFFFLFNNNIGMARARTSTRCTALVSCPRALLACPPSTAGRTCSTSPSTLWCSTTPGRPWAS
jgi:hypothetical protein